jgi:hypothetical protein
MWPACRGGSTTTTPTTTSWRGCSPSNTRRGSASCLPGVQRLGLFVPLGGTTLFLRRDALEEVGGWDAHNVTEDAELGLRLARAGYRTELVDTTTYEEATAAVGPWIRQRSRWLKGYIITWATAMRGPLIALARSGHLALHGAAGADAVGGAGLFPRAASVEPRGRALRRAAPADRLSRTAPFASDRACMMLSLVLSVAVSVHACRAAHLRRLRPLAPLVEFYYTLGTFAAWIGAFELMARPFFWAKTRHGVYGGLAKPEPEDVRIEPERLGFRLLGLFLQAHDEGDGQVILQRLRRPVAVAVADGIDDGGMFFQRLHPRPAAASEVRAISAMER